MKNILILSDFTFFSFQNYAQWTEDHKILAGLSIPAVIPNPSEQGITDAAIDGNYAVVGLPFAKLRWLKTAC